jgi:hypothetical protein
MYIYIYGVSINGDIPYPKMDGFNKGTSDELKWMKPPYRSSRKHSSQVIEVADRYH